MIGEYQAIHPKAKFRRFLVKLATLKQFIEKPIFLNLVNLSPALSKII